MSEFKVGDRVEAVKDSPYQNYKVGDEGTVTEIDGQITSQPIKVAMDNGQKIWPIIDCIKLITEEPMTVITALEKSITHWQEIVAVFGGAKVEEERARPQMGTDECALCTHFIADNNGGCSKCPLGACTADGLYGDVGEATSNADAYTASKAMLARLEELLVEEKGKAKKEEAAIRVGDLVICTTSFDLGVVSSAESIRERLREVMAVDSKRGVLRRSETGAQAWDSSNYTLIHRPTKDGK